MIIKAIKNTIRYILSYHDKFVSERVNKIISYNLKNKSIGNYKILLTDTEEFKALATNLLTSNKPFAIGRLGNNEVYIINFCKTGKISRFLISPVTFPFFVYPLKFILKRINKKKIMTFAEINCGIFPPKQDLLERFSDFALESINNMDELGYFYYEKEMSKLIKLLNWKKDHFYYGSGAEFFPYFHLLGDKRVLVISLFADTIQKQYKKCNGNLNLLHTANKSKPQFSFPNKFQGLITIKFPMVGANNAKNTPFKDWFDVYNWAIHEIEKVKDKFDIAFVGCSSYSIPLCSFIKNIGKQAICLASSVQILFGIKGNRFHKYGFYNDLWVNASTSEMPPEKNLIEKGCYW